MSRPVTDRERQLMQRDLAKDILRDAAFVLRDQFRHTFALRVIARVLERLAGRLEKPLP